MLPPDLFFLRNALVIWSFLWLHTNSRTIFFYCYECIGILTGIALKLYRFWYYGHFYNIFFSNAGTWGVFSISDIVLIEQILTSLVKFIPRCFLIFYVIPNRIVSFICLSTFHYWNCNWFLYVDFYILKIRWIHCLDPTGLWLSIWNSLYAKSNNLQIMTSILLPFQFECLLFLCCAN